MVEPTVTFKDTGVTKPFSQLDSHTLAVIADGGFRIGAYPAPLDEAIIASFCKLYARRLLAERGAA